MKKFEKITINGIKIHLFDDKVQIFNDKNVPIDTFTQVSDKIMRYLLAEAFIPKKMLKVEMVSP